MLLKHRPADMPVLPMRMQHWNPFADIDIADHIADELGHDRRNSSARNPPFQYQDSHWLQDDIDAECHCQNHRWHAAVAQSAQDIRLHLQEYEHHDTAIDNADERYRTV